MSIQRLYKTIEYALTLKYFRKIELASPDPAARFDLDGFRHAGRLYNIRAWIIDRVMLGVLFILREVWPNPQIGRLLLVTRASEVEQVLADEEHFIVPFGPEMEALAGANSVLGMDGAPHARLNRIIRDVLRPDDMEQILASTRKMTLSLIATSAGHIDAVRDVITRVSTETCSDYFGLHIEDHDAFGEWSIAISQLLFADPFGDARTREIALAGAAQMRQVIHRAINQARKRPDERTIVGRLLRLQAEQRQSDAATALTDKDICGILMSLVTGFVPTNTLAAGKILQELRRRPRRMEEAKALARQGERDRLKGVLLEAARLNAALSPGQWRYAHKEQVIAAGTWREKTVRQGTVLLVATRSALRDRRKIEQPSEFRSGRKLDPNWMFGFGPHKCLGQHIATEHITEIFSVLLAQPGLTKVAGKHGQFAWAGPFPERLDMEFGKTAPGVQSMVTICAPLKPGSTQQEVERLIADLDKTADLKRALDETGIVHFASLAAIEAGDAARPAPCLVLELNVDGTPETTIPIVARSTVAQLRSIFDHTEAGGSDLAGTFTSCALDLKTRPWGAIGLNFNGTPEFPVADIEMQQRLATFARKALTHFIESEEGIGSRASPALKFIRDLIRQHPHWVAVANDASDPARAQKIADFLKEGAEFKQHLILPGRKRLLISEWKERSNEDAAYHFLKSWDFWRPATAFLVLAALMSVGIFLAIAFYKWIGLPGQILISLTGGAVSAAMLVIALAITLVMLLRYYERTDVPDDRDPELSKLEKNIAREDLPGHAQNHFMAVTLLKRPGWFRKLTLALSLWGIKQLVSHAYRPGFVLNMGTIHYAKWFRLPKTDKLIFLSNYDGSWESYLEDFIMKAHAGQSAAWSNGAGFPKTKLLIFEGAQDGDRFKRWVRRQQVPTQFWYSRFPKLTTSEIRNNAVIHQGLARAHTDSAARSWLACFGSMQRPDHAIESEEIQSLLFRGFKRSDHAAYALIELPDRAERRAEWLKGLLPHAGLPPSLRQQLKAEVTQVTFGDHPFRLRPELQDLATFVAFSANGLSKLGLSAGGDGGLSTFAGVFNIGMANRARILGDRHDAKAPWRWTDAVRRDEAGNEVPRIRTADAIVIVYGVNRAQCESALAVHRKLLGGAEFIDVIHCEPVEKDVDSKRRVFREHFGFRDGISQPVIRGTHRLAEGAHERDIVEPGEFVLGYRNNQGYYPPAIRVSAETDLNDRLPDVIAGAPPTFPSFEAEQGPIRDFGRNGTFLVVRQMQQHVERFNTFTKEAAEKINRGKLGNALDAKIDAEWVAAKMMGRQKNGDPQVLRPGGDVDEAPKTSAATINDFAFAHDDPQGLRCPFGAHIRRANPRDGLRPDDAMQQSITNRHRLLRRGRAYEIPHDGAAGGNGAPSEKGIVFTCLCADLERQFEFVQQTWIASTSFHGLTGEVDPIIGNPDPTKKGVFTIPTALGPITLEGLEQFVTVRAGGYFFLPSYSAIHYLLDRNKDPEGTQGRPPAPA